MLRVTVRLLLIPAIIFLLVGSDDPGHGEVEAGQGPKLDGPAIMKGLADHFRHGTFDGRNLKSIQMRAADGDCNDLCIASAQLVASAYVGPVKDVAIAVIEGAIQRLCKPAMAAGEIVKSTTLETIRRARDANDPILYGTTNVMLGDLVQQYGGDPATSCAMTYAVTYDRASSTVTALFICNCSDSPCSFTLSYKAGPAGRVKGPVTFTRL